MNVASPTGQQLVDTTSRTHLLLAKAGLVDSLEEAGLWLAARRIAVRVGADACNDEYGQAAALTAVSLAARASIPVTVTVADPRAILSAGPWKGLMLGETLGLLGDLNVHQDNSADVILPPLKAELLIGESTESRRSGASEGDIPRLQVSWDGWVAGVRSAGERLPERNGCVLAAAAAAALAVSEVFSHLAGHLDAAWRDISLSLWDPLAADPFKTIGPRLDWLPDRWQIVGLGHLGQAAAWCISLLPYPARSGEVWLVDDDFATEANISTGVLTMPSDASVGPAGDALRKTRLVSKALERAGRPTRMIENRLDTNQTRWNPAFPSVALIGVDNLDTRRHLSKVGWPLCVDSGLGSTASSFDALSIYALDTSQSSAEIMAWRTQEADSGSDPVPAFNELRSQGVDECGIVMLQGRAVGASYVGMTAAALATCEPLRRLHGSPGIRCVGLSLDQGVPTGASVPSEGSSEVVIPYVSARRTSP